MENLDYGSYEWGTLIPLLKERGTNLSAWCKLHGFNYKTAYGLATALRPPCDLGPASLAIASKALEEGLIKKAGGKS